MLSTDRPYIGERDVRRVLDMMEDPSARRKVPASLQSLMVVEEFLADPTIPPVQHGRVFALQEICAQIIQRELRQHRYRLDLEVQPPDTRIEALEQIHKDGQNGSFELIAWSLLYYCYVRVDLHISRDDFAEAVNVVDRTVRRYRDRSVWLLTQSLIVAEWQTRIRQQRKRLIAQLPDADRSQLLLGRQQLLEDIRIQLSTDEPSLLIVTGPAGIGKTVLVQKAIRTLIDQQIDGRLPLDQLIWINEPATVEDVSNAIAAAPNIPDLQTSLREWMLVYKTLIVIDDADTILADTESLEALLQFLSPATVILTSQFYHPLPGPGVHCHLPELESDMVNDLIEAIWQATPGGTGPVTEEDRALVRRVAGGNPQAVIFVVKNFILGDRILEDDVIQRLVERSVSHLNPAERRAWYCAALCPPRKTRPDQLMKVWPEVEPAHLHELVRRHLITMQDDGNYYMASIVEQHMQYLYHHVSDDAKMVDGLLWSLDLHRKHSGPYVHEVIRHILSLDWLTVDAELQQRWLVNAAEGVSVPDSVAANAYDTQLHYGISLRKLGQWADAEQVFKDLMQKSGLAGHFKFYTFAQFELAILLRLRGQFGEAVRLMEYVEQATQRYRIDSLWQKVVLERVQIAVEMRDPETARTYLSQLDELASTPRLLALHAETERLEGQYAECQHLLELALTAAESDRITTARLYDLYGRLYADQRQFKDARECLMRAVDLFDTVRDPYALGRCLTNLGVANMFLGAFDKASHLLNRAQDIQYKLGDRLGLAITEHNLSHLNIER